MSDGRLERVYVYVGYQISDMQPIYRQMLRRYMLTCICYVHVFVKYKDRKPKAAEILLWQLHIHRVHVSLCYSGRVAVITHCRYECI